MRIRGLFKKYVSNFIVLIAIGSIFCSQFNNENSAANLVFNQNSNLESISEGQYAFIECSFPLKYQSSLPYIPYEVSEDTDLNVNEEEEQNNENLIPFSFHNPLVSEYIRTNIIKNYFFNTLKSIQNRGNIPLFILQHSWRSFLK
jgi:hypothetical protein